MAHKKQSFRFRIPWLSGTPAARPAIEPPPRRPKDRPKSPTKLDTNVPIQQLQSPPSPTKTQGVPRAEPEKQSPSHPPQPTSSVFIESSLTSQLDPPPRPTTPTAVNSPSPSLQPSSHKGSPSQISITLSSPETQSRYPYHSALDGAIMVSKLPAEESIQPASYASKQEKETMVMFEPIPQEAETIQLQSPSHLALDGVVVVPKPAAEESSRPASSVSEKEKEMVVSEPMPQEDESKINSPSKAIIKSPDTFSQPENLSAQPTPILPEAALKTQSKSPETSSQPERMPTQREGSEPQSFHFRIPWLSGTQAKDSLTWMFRADKKQHGERKTVERKVMFAISNPSEKDVRVVSSEDQGTRNVSSISPERPVSSNEEKAPLQKGIKDDISKFVYKLATVHPSHLTDDKEFSIITLAGDNRGATMHVGSESANKEEPIHIHRAYRTDPEEITEVTTDAEENSNTKKGSHSSTKHDEVGKAYVNSNIQSINNSLMFHGSVSERDPSVQVTLPQKPAYPIKSDDKLSLETHKNEFNISRVEKPTYQPMVRRRCLRGLFLEPSDSDPDNPDKPRRHGCKFSCDKNEKVEDIEDL